MWYSIMQYYMVLLYSIIIPPSQKNGVEHGRATFLAGISHDLTICSGGFNTEAMWSMCSTGSWGHNGSRVWDPHSLIWGMVV